MEQTIEKNLEHPRLVVNPFVIYLGFLALAALLQFLLPLPVIISLKAAHIAGAVILIVSFIFGLPALRLMFKARTSPNPGRPTTTLVLAGPYRFTRNPMYLGLTCMYAGLIVFLRLPWGLLFLPLVVWLITSWVVRPEEQYLEKQFGSEYTRYKKTVRRWI